MKELMIKPEIYHFDKVREFAEEFQIGEGDLMVTNEYIYKPFFGDLNLKCDVIFQEKYGQGEPPTTWLRQCIRILRDRISV